MHVVQEVMETTVEAKCGGDTIELRQRGTANSRNEEYSAIESCVQVAQTLFQWQAFTSGQLVHKRKLAYKQRTPRTACTYNRVAEPSPTTLVAQILCAGWLEHLTTW